ncbi:hypothetical protein EDD21DRAFT_410273 [Dissophora ornata]|nr:hypothetical protein EDD21DRAFT_410273 [Dissophora ornata]
MQPSLFSNVRTNLSHLPRSISPHLTSPTSPASPSSSIRSLSPSRHSSQLRSRSASPSPRRFASVLAYHATPPPDGYGKRNKAAAADQQQQQQLKPQQLEGEEFDKETLRASRSDNNRDREESPSHIAFRNLEESWKRFELESATSSSSPVLTSPSNSNSTLGSPILRAASPSSSPLSRPPYKELIECASLNNEGRVQTGDETATATPPRETTAGTATSEFKGTPSAPVNTKNSKPGDIDHGRTEAMTASPSSKNKPSNSETSFSAPSSFSTSASSPSSSSTLKPLTATASPSATKTASEYFKHAATPHGYTTTFLASDEARLILDLPSLLGKDPNMISEVLATPIPVQPTRPGIGRTSSTTISAAKSAAGAGSSDQTSQLISELDAKAETTAKAMTKRYAAKNLNMTETEAHRMVQLMAAEIVTLHEEREVMLQKMEKAKQEMLEAARLLRMKAAATQTSATEEEEMKDMSSLSSDDSRRQKMQEMEEEEEEERRMYNASLYDRDEWKR